VANDAGAVKARGHRYRFVNVPTSLVTGSAGFIGSHLYNYLLALGHGLICVDNLDTGSLQNIQTSPIVMTSCSSTTT
jgi:nucleoside-diphosphate-sugar epimerase